MPFGRIWEAALHQSANRGELRGGGWASAWVGRLGWEVD